MEKVEINKGEGYKLFTISNIPLKVSENIDNNIIRIYYKKIIVKPVDPDVPVDPDNPTPVEPIEESAYKVEYYYNGTKNNVLTDVIEAKVGEAVYEETIKENIEKNKPESCMLVTVLNVPLKVTVEINSNVIKVYYVV